MIKSTPFQKKAKRKNKTALKFKDFQYITIIHVHYSLSFVGTIKRSLRKERLTCKPVNTFYTHTGVYFNMRTDSTFLFSDSLHNPCTSSHDIFEIAYLESN